MAVMKFNKPPEAKLTPRAHVVGHGDGVSLAHAAFGDKVEGAAQINTLGDNIEIAGRWLSTAPYRDPNGPVAGSSPPPPNPFGYRDASRHGKCTANDDTCNGSATISSGRLWCAGHAQQNAAKAEVESSTSKP
jgi:hypothetical protein